MAARSMLLAAVLLLACAAAHRPLLNSPAGGQPYSNADNALLVPWVTSSWAVQRVVEV